MIVIHSVKSTHQYFCFYEKKIVVNIANLEQGPVSNKRSGKFTFYSGIRGKTARKGLNYRQIEFS